MGQQKFYKKVTKILSWVCRFTWSNRFGSPDDLTYMSRQSALEIELQQA